MLIMNVKNKNITLDFEKICRACCSMSNESMMPVFKMNFHRKIMRCTGIEVWQNDGLPAQICKKCVAKLHIAYQFKRMCENTDIQLRVYRRKCSNKYSGDSEDEDINIAEETQNESVNVAEKSEIQEQATNNKIGDHDDSGQTRVTSVDITELTVPQDFSYQDCIPLSDTRHFDTLPGMNMNPSDISYDPHVIFGGASIMPTVAPLNLTTQSQHPMASNYNIQSITPSANFTSNYSITNLSQTPRLISPSQILHMDNLTDQTNDVLQHTTADDYIQHVVEVPSTVEEFNNRKVPSPSLRVSKRESMKEFFKKCEEENRCSICNKKFIGLGKLTRHMKVHGEKNFKCKTCNKSFVHMGNYRVHLRVHSDERPFKCDICNRGCRQQQDLEKHLRTHTGEKPHQCDKCPKAFSTSSNLVVHRRIHTGEKPYVCWVCSKTFCQSNELTKHMRVHTGEKSHVCIICGKGFNGSSTLMVHMRTHTGQKPYICQICDKGFSQSSGLTTHLQVHSARLDFHCSFCSKSFSTYQRLDKHLLSHNPNEHYCTYAGCYKKFMKKSGLRRHLKLHEKRKTYQPIPLPQLNLENSIDLL